ncbi:Cathepsin B-like cysteine proteinase 5 (Cysteine protease-related 5) [Durusdinium trenchii]|uniref:Cathepsin B-like cysteine proteinase 5 (Cysteine protease-related 5) n=1 Tax=Durusdinium trenchii TaxID=1381693 RepID=A0ABP0NND0_9DINO
MDLQRRTGIQHDNSSVHASFLQTASITETMRTRSLPATFEAQDQWPHCREIIGRIHNQGQCGSCWAFGASSALDSRLCIATGGVFNGAAAQLSRGYVASCAPPGGEDGCGGGWSWWVFDLMANSGVPTGGTAGCSPYFGHGDGTDHFAQSGVAPPCPTMCGNSAFGRSIDEARAGRGRQRWSNFGKDLGMDCIQKKRMNEDLLSRFILDEDKFKLATSNYIQIASYKHPFPARVYHLAREAIMTGGPIPAYLYADGGFMSYTSGVYTHACDSWANHAITVIGWGPDYWHCLNSWGDWWGDQGRFKVGLCVLTDFQIPTTSLAGDSAHYSFPLEGETHTPQQGLNPSESYTHIVQEAYAAQRVRKKGDSLDSAAPQVGGYFWQSRLQYIPGSTSTYIYMLYPNLLSLHSSRILGGYMTFIKVYTQIFLYFHLYFDHTNK